MKVLWQEDEYILVVPDENALSAFSSEQAREGRRLRAGDQVITAAADLYDGKVIGHLQRNKVRQVVGTASLIHSVGSLELLEEIRRQAEKRALVQDVLLEVNIGGEPGKSGFAPDSLRDAAEQAAAMPHVRIRGLMTIPPIQREPHGNLPFFAKVARLYVDIGRDLYDNKFDCLSMGMSDDFEDAIEAGATMVRVGSAIFGHRHYQ